MAGEPVVPRPSASVILVRDGPAGVETFMVQRHARSPVAPRAYVFPGGTTRSDDVQVAPEPAALARRLSDRSDEAVEPSAAGALFTCAVRELFEEAGVLCVRDASGRLLTVDASDRSLQERLQSTRLALQAHELSFARVLGEWRWAPAFDLLLPFSHWVTPSALPARFDTWFFVCAMPPRQAALHDTIETSAGFWLRPADVLAGDYEMVHATAAHLRRLTPFATVTALQTFAAAKEIRRVQPTVTSSEDGIQVTIAPHLADTW